ncbi:hypothetical protein SAMN02745165_01192 [Malonomonas rubra DSM 5091]|uniref:Uncharacterized protein n=1 Tax=Malonomonas rubra DSM 5091 TaxID=1122189 RepID=A0A1M6F8U7_MALRU|nr:hypothetical protein [Malonomonas rubra]SHI94071.1 hypothetical protein SAMN02745165_01192 [Malonomonas rubra DSM 5091]
MHRQRHERWKKLVEQIAQEYRALPASEKTWIAEQLQQVETLQQQLNQLFEQGNGLTSCADCLGDCCAKGHNHMTLANLLSYLQRNDLPPQPDFSRTCPFLGERGCLLPVTRRPYNCISFVCDIIEHSLTSSQVEEFYRCEQQLRVVYRQFAERYSGGGMTGLLLQSERLGNGPFLQRKNLPQD